jgi:hypothetical protein
VLERLIGFDARVALDAVSRYWDAQRRRTYLLRDDVLAPLSVDPLVWPSFFDSGNGVSMTPELRQQSGLTGQLGAVSRLPSWIGPNCPLWEDLDALRSHLDAASAAVPKGVLVAATALSEDEAAPAPSVQGELLGYDVADSALISGVSNCGYSSVEADELRLTWSWLLNEYHLFEIPETAFDFRWVADKRVPEHAPFYVYGLYRMEALP